MADADERWGSQKKTQNSGHRRKREIGQARGSTYSEKNVKHIFLHLRIIQPL